ncbi:hypothetical protein [Paractinoplanes durhamensis]|uniref:Uncharacterized protein n=1 Tax=Paractinoplanes durhamensis TaxID=113563 RepID=A0ABQ3Z3G7_9ACTN|nr:hypothetical protein [Actinoplanes durhamensis]GIE04341.1 hypothetical protein Adu01nite_56910 [Actinoplanes durhamensis]
MLIDWSREFDVWLTELERRANAGHARSQEQLDLVNTQLLYLQDLKEPPTEDTPTLRRVRQSGRYQVWRISHPFRNGVGVRLIVWFPPDAPPLIVLFGNNKAHMGDVFYDSVASRADQVIAAYLRLSNGGGDE